MEKAKLPKKIEGYIENHIKGNASEHNTELIRIYLTHYLALPSQPSDSRLLTVANRMRKVCLLLKNKPLDALTESDLQDMNLELRAEMLESAGDYRKILKHYLKTTDKEKYHRLIDSDYLRNPRRQNGGKKLVDPAKFWSEQECTRYLLESKRESLKQGAWAAIWLSCGLRPHEAFGLHKKDIKWEEPETLVIQVRAGKTGARTIVLQNNEGCGVWEYLQPYLKTLPDNVALFPCSYQAMKKKHLKICKFAEIGEDKATNFYIMRKQVLTRFYNSFGLAKAAALAGHVAGSSSMKHYVAMNEQMLKQQDLTTIQMKICPNPACNIINSPHDANCQKCGSPLDRQQFAAIFERNMAELIDLKLRLFKSEVQLMVAGMTKK